MAKPQTPDPYGTLFDFVFATQKKGKRRGKPSEWTMPPVSSGLAEALMHVAGAPYQYAVEGLLKDMNQEVDALTGVKVQPTRGYEVRIGLSGIAQVLTDPRKAFGFWQGKYEEGKKYARVAGASRFMDSAIFALMAKNAGLDNSTAAGFGFNLFQQDIGLYTNAYGSGASHLSRYIRSQEAMKVMSENYAMKYSRVSKDEMEQIVSASYNAGAFAPAGTADSDKSKGDKDARLDHMKQALVTKGLSQDQAEWAAQDFWGSRRDDKDMGLWLSGHEGDKDRIHEEMLVRKKALDAMLWRVQMLKDREPDPAKKAKLTVLQRRISEYATLDKSFPFALGTQIGRIYHLQSWAKGLPGVATSVLAAGRVDQLLKHLNADGGLNYKVGDLVGFLDKADDDGNFKYGASLFNRGTPSNRKDILIQKFAEGLYYWHPVNVAKGLLWDGRHLAWLSRHYKNKGNTARSDFFKKFAARYPKNALNRASVWIQDKTVGRLKKLGYDALKKAGFFRWASGKLGREVIGLPIREVVKQLLIKGITTLVGATVLPGIGGVIGFVADQIINIGISIASKLIKPALEFGVLLLWGIIAIVGMIIFAVTEGPSDKMQRYLNTPISAVGGVQGDGSGLAEESQPPENYEGECFTASAIACAQGPCGSVSHLENGDYAVDLNWAGMGSTTGIQAPSDGVVLGSSTPQLNQCEDGTNRGGVVYFQDSSGYVWGFVHAEPVASGPVDKGDPIGLVQMTEPDVEWGDCWKGAHAHVMIKNPEGKYVDAEEFLNSIDCSFSCPAGDAC